MLHLLCVYDTDGHREWSSGGTAVVNQNFVRCVTACISFETWSIRVWLSLM